MARKLKQSAAENFDSASYVKNKNPKLLDISKRMRKYLGSSPARFRMISANKSCYPVSCSHFSTLGFAEADEFAR